MKALSRLPAQFSFVRWLALVLLCSTTHTIAAANPALEIEPNNTVATATPYAIGGGESRGQLSSATDLDYFVFSSTGGVVTFSLSPENSSYNGTSLQASILAADGSVLASKDINSDSTVVSLRANTFNGSNYYLLIQKNQYSLMQKNYVINAAYTPTVRIEIEPNNTKLSATAIVGSSEIRGQLSSGTDVDYFIFNTAGGVVNFSIGPETNSYDGSSMSISIVSQDGSVLAGNTINSDSPPVSLGVSTVGGINYYLMFTATQYRVMRKDYVIVPSGASLIGLPQTIGAITFTPATLVIGGTSTASATGGASGNAVSFSSSTAASICTVSSSGTVTGVGVGACAVTANQAGSANYAPAPPVTQDIPVVTGPAVISLNPNALSFGEQHIGSTSQPITVVLSNTGGSTLTIESIVVSLNPGDFAVSGCGASLGADASCNLSVTFAPTATAARLGVVRVTGNAANSSQSVNLDGIGVLSNVPICTLSAVPATIARGRSATLTANCSPAAWYAWTGGTCEGTTVATCTVAPVQTTTYSVTGSNGAESDTASATVTVKPVDLTPILMLLLD